MIVTVSIVIFVLGESLFELPEGRWPQNFLFFIPLLLVGIAGLLELRYRTLPPKVMWIAVAAMYLGALTVGTYTSKFGIPWAYATPGVLAGAACISIWHTLRNRKQHVN
jgi:hypothetical protein